jgi:hypothetical protein
MRRYTVTAWCDRPFYARCEIEAETPQEALAKARAAIHDEPAEECDEGYYWDEWTVDTDEQNDVLRHLDEPARLRESAPILLEALEFLLKVHGEFCSASDVAANPQEYPEILKARVAIAAATGKEAV